MEQAIFYALFVLFVIGSVALFALLLFRTFYRWLPYETASVRNVSIAERSSGSAVIVNVAIDYEVRSSRRHAVVVFSGSMRRRDRLLLKAEKTKSYFKDGYAKFYHLPFLSRIGVLDGTVARSQMVGGVLMLMIFVMLAAMLSAVD